MPDRRQPRGLWLLALLLVAGLVWLLQRSGGEPAPIALEPRAQDAPPFEPPMAAETATGPERALLSARAEAPEAIAPDEVDLAHPFGFQLAVRVVDAFGLPVPGATVFLAPPGCGFARLPETTDALGRAVLSFGGREQEIRLAVAVVAWGIAQPLRSVALHAEAPRTLTVVATGRRQSDATVQRLGEATADEQASAVRRVRRERRGRLRTTDDLDVLCGRTQLLFRMFDCTNCHQESEVAAYAALARAPRLRRSLHPHAVFRDLPGDTSADEPEAREEPSAAKKPDRVAGGTMLAGTVRTFDGTPVANVPVAWLRDDGAVLARSDTEADGTFVLGPLPAGRHRLHAGGGPEGTTTAIELVGGAPTQQWNPVLAQNAVGRGVARDEAGAPLVRLCVEAEQDDGSWADAGWTRPDGSFVIPDLPASAECLLWRDEQRTGLPILYGRAVLPDGAETALSLSPEAPTRARLRLHAVAPEHALRPQVEMRVHQLDTGRVAWLTPSRMDEAFELDQLPAGPYRIEIGAPIVGWVTPGETYVDGRGLWDLGRVPLPAPARLRLVADGGHDALLAGPHALYRRTPKVDVRASYRRMRDGTLLVPAGELLLLWHDDAGEHAVGFRMAPGQAQTLDLRGR